MIKRKKFILNEKDFYTPNNGSFALCDVKEQEKKVEYLNKRLDSFTDI